jgi:amino acid transporter/nucleotide-binding universal stress UspA family protein
VTTGTGDDVALSRELGFPAVLTTAMGTMIGAGIFVLPGVAAANAGPAASLSFLIAGVIAGMATFSAAELSTAMPKAGGSYFFVSRAMGPLVGTVVGLGAWLSLVFKGSFALVGLGQYLLHFSAIPVIATALVGGVALILVNWLGAGLSGTLQNLVVVVLLAILGVFIARGLFAVDRNLLTPFVHFEWTSVTLTTGIVFISYLGIVKATAIAEEVEDPGRNIPLGMLTAVGLVTVLYVLVMLIVTGTLPIEGIGAREAPLADSAQLFLGGLGGLLVGISGILATTSTGNAAILASARFPFAMARDGLMHPKMNEISPRFDTPSWSLWFTGLVMLVLVLLFDVEALAKLGGTFGILVFALLNVAVLLLRRAQPPWYEPAYESPLFPWMQIVGTVAALALIPQMGWLSQVSAAVFVVLGAGWYYWQRQRTPAVLPDYGLVDQLQRVRQVRSIETKRERLAEPMGPPSTEADREPAGTVLVEVVDGQPVGPLLRIAASLADRHEARIEAAVVSEVPDQVPLYGFVPDIDLDWRAEVEQRLASLDAEAEFGHVLTHDRDRALTGRIHEGTVYALLGWEGPPRRSTFRDTHVDAVLRASQVPVAIARDRGLEAPSHVVVASGGGPYEQVEVDAGDAIAAAHDARLTFVKVLPPDASEERVQNARRYLQELGGMMTSVAQIELVCADDVARALVEASDEADLLVMGAKRPSPIRQRMVGPLVQRVAEETRASVLVVKGEEPEGYWWEAIVDRFTGDR